MLEHIKAYFKDKDEMIRLGYYAGGVAVGVLTTVMYYKMGGGNDIAGVAHFKGNGGREKVVVIKRNGTHHGFEMRSVFEQ